MIGIRCPLGADDQKQANADRIAECSQRARDDASNDLIDLMVAVTAAIVMSCQDDAGNDLIDRGAKCMTDWQAFWDTVGWMANEGMAAPTNLASGWTRCERLACSKTRAPRNWSDTTTPWLLA